MELSRSFSRFHINVNNTNNLRNSSTDVPVKTFRLHSASLTETAQEEVSSLISKETRFATDSNEIHDSQHHRDVHLQTTETFLVSPDSNQNKTENNHPDPIKYTTENIETTSIKQHLQWLKNCTVDFTKTAIMPLYENGFNGFDWQPTLENTAITFGSIFYPILSQAYFLKKTGACGIILNLISSTEAKPVTNIINIDHADTLQIIGRSDEFLPNGHYRLTANIDARNIKQPIK